MKKCFRVLAQPTPASAALLLLRIVVGVALAIHGWGKFQSPFGWMGPDAPVPAFFQFLAAFSELGGGIALVLGLVTPLACLGIAITMAVAVSMHAFVLKDPFVSLTGARAFDLPATYFAAALVLKLVGPGKFSADAKIFGPK